MNPRLVYAAASGFGWSGPPMRPGATDAHIQAFPGSASVNRARGAGASGYADRAIST